MTADAARAQPPPAAEPVLELLGERAQRAIGGMLYTLLVVLPLVMAAMVLGGRSTRAEIAIVALLLLAAAALAWLHRRRRHHLVLGALAACLVLAGAGLGFAFGSIRSVGTLALVAAIVVAGLFLGRAALLALLAASAGVAAALITLENAGRLPTPNYAVGLTHWVVYVATLAAIALNIWVVRSVVVDAARRAREGEARLAAVLRSTPAALITTSLADGRVHDVSAAYERIFGLAPEQALGRTVLELGLWAEPGDREGFVRRLRRDGRAAGVPARLRRAGGEPFDAVISAESLDIGGEPIVVATISDVSAERRARQAQRASEERFVKAFELSPIGMTITRLADGAYLEANAADERTLGYTRAELAGKSTVSIGAWASVAERERFVARLKADGRVLGHETRMRDKWGRPVDALIYAVLIELDGETCVLASTLNVTDRRREEELILEAARGVSVATGEAFFRRLVEHLARATGADRAQVGELVDGGRRVRTVARCADGAHSAQVEYELAGTPCEVVLAQRELMSWERGVAARFPQDEPLARDGIEGYVGAPLIGVDGRPAGVLNVLARRPLPRTERLEAVFRIFAARAEAELARLQREREIIALNESLEQRVRQRTAELEAVNRELEAFSYSVSHDLRAPLRGIDGLTRLIEERHGGELGEPAREYLRRARSGVARMGLLIDDLLALSGVNRAALKPLPVDLSSMARAIAAELHGGQPERRVRWEIADDLAARADPGLVHIALSNLLGNAFKYTGRCEEARITFAEAGRHDSLVDFVVRDNGAGFDMAQAQHLFEPFRRLHGQGEFEGTGIGLAIVRRVVERHGGRIRGEGRAGDGAAFVFSLPARGSG